MVGILAFILAVVSAPGCARRTLSQEEAVRSTIERYDALLADGYRALNMNRMTEVATPLQAQDEYTHMSALAEGGVRLDPDLKKITFVSVSIESTAAHAETRETWDYLHYSRETGKLVLSQKDLVYDLAWDLDRQPDGRWLVSDVRAISATSPVQPSVLGTLTPLGAPK